MGVSTEGGQQHCAPLGNDVAVVTGFTSEQGAQELIDKLGLELSLPAIQIDQEEITDLVCALYRLVRGQRARVDSNPAQFVAEVLHGSQQHAIPSEAPDTEARHALALALMMNGIELPDDLLEF